MKKILTSLLALGLSIALAFAADRDHQLKVYNWADYIDEKLIAEFEQWYEQQTGEKVEIIYSLFDVNEIMLSKIEKGQEDFDVVCPSEYIIERMLKANLLLPIQRDFGTAGDYTANVSPFIMDMVAQMDNNGVDANLYTVPYMWGTFGLLYNKAYLSSEQVRSWNILKDPYVKGRLLLKEAFRDVYTSLNIALHKGLIDDGHLSLQDVCFDTSAESIAAVESFISEVKPNLAGWEADFGKDQLTKGKAWLNTAWSGDAQWAIEEAATVGIELGYNIPDEGSIIWFDGWVIPKYAKNVKAASYFINFLCKPENAIRNMNLIGYVSAIGGDDILVAMTDRELYEPVDASYFFGENAKVAYINNIQYPDANSISRCGMMHDRGTDELLAMWTRLKGDNASVGTAIVVVILLAAIVAFAILGGKKKKNRKRAKARS